jgi:hypothetical protein
MLNKKLYVLVLFFIGMCNTSFSQRIWTMGPMIHFNFGGEKPRVSYSFEVAYWNLDHFFYSIDGGLEVESGKFRLYSELQTGIGLAGIACGPVLEINTRQGGTHLGVQGSVWANYFLGMDVRKRWVNKTTYTSLGLYVKAPFASSGSNNDGNESHHHWDWD